jgi:ATP-dependent DNA ligase
MTKLADLKKTCQVLHLHPIPTKNSINKETGEREKTLSMDDCIKSIQQFYLEQRKQNGTYRRSIDHILEMESPMLCLLIKHKKPEVQEQIWDDKNMDWIFEEKLDGCSDYDTMITLSDGTKLPIGEIVENKLEVSVKSYNEQTGEIESKRITNWFDNGIKHNFKKIKQGNRTLRFTDNHKFYNGKEYIEAKDMNEGRMMVWYSDSSFQALLGSILGDTSISTDNRISSKAVKIRCSHSIKQEGYLEYKSKLFNMDWNKREYYTSGYDSECVSATSKTEHTFNEAYYLKEELFHKSPIDYYRKMGIIGLAFLFMDDGTNQGNQIKLSVNSFNELQANDLNLYINELGIKSKVSEENGYPCIVMTQIPARKFSAVVSNYIYKDMRYKLHEGYRNDYFIDISKENSKPHLARCNIGIPNKSVYYSDHAYDIEVEDNHNYFADDVLVHNCRAILCYDPVNGFDMYSRNLSNSDQLPINYGEKILWPKLDLHELTFSFMLDCEIVPKNKEIDKTGDFVPVADTQLNLISSILALNTDDSRKVQEKNPVKFMAFDVIYVNEKPLFNKTLRERKQILKTLYPYLVKAGLPVEFPMSLEPGGSKRDFYNRILNAGGEGVVAKDLNTYYDTLGRRAGEWVKIKRSVSQTLDDYIDAFVIGFEVGTPGTANENLVSSLKFGVELLGPDNEPILDTSGDPVTHHIATVGGLTQELKEAITTRDVFGNITLKQEIYGKVASIDGQDLSSRSLRFAHAVLVAWRDDRSANTCRVRRDILEKMVL